MDAGLKAKLDEADRAHTDWVATYHGGLQYGSPERKEWDERARQLRFGVESARTQWAASITDDDVTGAVMEYLRNDEDDKWLSATSQVVDYVARTLGINPEYVAPRVRKALEAQFRAGNIQRVRAEQAGGRRPYGTTGASWLYGTPQHFTNLEARNAVAAREAAALKERRADAYRLVAEAVRRAPAEPARTAGEIDAVIAAAAAHIARKGE